jgi:Cu(I)/Ag(I) efflux system membrane fusion protein
MKMKLITLVVVTLGLAATPSLFAQGCCGAGTAMKEGCSMGGSAAANETEHNACATALAKPVQAVFDNYLKVQGSLALDSLQGVSALANEMAKTIKDDPNKGLSEKAATQATALAQAQDLDTARAAFKDLSISLIAYLRTQKVTSGSYHEAYCPMAKAGWLQTGTTILNPYMGKAMAHCGEFKS